MRHRKKRHHLNKAADQRKALMRSLATNLFQHDQLLTTRARAKALKAYSDEIITLAKKGGIHSIRQVNKRIYNKRTGEIIEDVNTGKDIPETVLRRIMRTVGPRCAERQSGYTRIVLAPPRKGDAAPMAIVEFVD